MAQWIYFFSSSFFSPKGAKEGHQYHENMNGPNVTSDSETKMDLAQAACAHTNTHKHTQTHTHTHTHTISM